jgi:hypothetical protein
MNTPLARALLRFAVGPDANVEFGSGYSYRFAIFWAM